MAWLRSRPAVILLGILALIIVGFASWRIYLNIQAGKISSFEECVTAGNEVRTIYPAQCSAYGRTFTQESAIYTDADNTFTITYPTALNFVRGAEGADQPPAAEAPAFDIFKLVPDGKDDQGMAVMLDKTNSIAGTILKNSEANGHSVEERKIGNYDAKYIRVAFDSEGEQYTDHHYFVFNGEEVVYFNYREKYQNQTAGTSFDNAEYIDEFEAAINSIQFN